MVQVANTLQLIMTQFTEFTQNQALQFEAQKRQQHKATVESMLNLSLARPAVGQFEDTEDDIDDQGQLSGGSVGGGSDMGDIGVSAIVKKDDEDVEEQEKQQEEEHKNQKIQNAPEEIEGDTSTLRHRANTEPPSNKVARQKVPPPYRSSTFSRVMGFSSPPIRKTTAPKDPLSLPKRDPSAPPLIESTKPDPNPPLLEKILSQKMLPQYEEVENELVKEEYIIEAGAYGGGICTSTQTDYDETYDDTTAIDSTTQVSPTKPKVMMVDARSSPMKLSPTKVARSAGSSPARSPTGSPTKKVTSSTSTEIYISPVKLLGGKKIARVLEHAWVRLSFWKWRVTFIPPTPLSTVPAAANSQTAKVRKLINVSRSGDLQRAPYQSSVVNSTLRSSCSSLRSYQLEEVSENCIFALRTRISSTSPTLVSLDRGETQRVPKPTLSPFLTPSKSLSM